MWRGSSGAVCGANHPCGLKDKKVRNAARGIKSRARTNRLAAIRGAERFIILANLIVVEINSRFLTNRLFVMKLERLLAGS